MKKISCVLLSLFVSAVWTMSSADKLTYLCDEWNVLELIYPYQTVKYFTTTDTLINAERYVKIEKDHHYEGALREDEDANIYFIPTGGTHEFLLYAFHAQVGDTLTNLWIDEHTNSMPNNVVVADIQSSTPRKFRLDVELFQDDISIHESVVWIEGVGHQEGTPISNEMCLGCTGGEPKAVILCAYKDGEQVYSSRFTKWYDCYYMQDLPITTTDTPSASKIIRDGQIFILRGDKTYTLQGQEVK